MVTLGMKPSDPEESNPLLTPQSRSQIRVLPKGFRVCVPRVRLPAPPQFPERQRFDPVQLHESTSESFQFAAPIRMSIVPSVIVAAGPAVGSDVPSEKVATSPPPRSRNVVALMLGWLLLNAPPLPSPP
jgi:hypothetical protein